MTTTDLQNPTQPKLSLVIPCHNEEQRLAKTLSMVSPTFLRENWELLIVDDGSSDNTAVVAEKLLEPLGSLGRLVKLESHSGKGEAVRRGMLQASGDFVFFTDADLPYGLSPVQEGLPRMEEEGLDLLVGERTPGSAKERPLLRSIVSWFFRTAVSMLFRLKTKDTQCGLKGLHNRTARRLLPMMTEKGFTFDLELLLMAEKENLRTGHIPVTLINSDADNLKLIWHGGLMLLDMLALRLEAWGLLGAKHNSLPLAPAIGRSLDLSAFIVLALLAVSLSIPLLPLGFYTGDITTLDTVSILPIAKMLFTGEGIRAVSICHFTPMMGITLRIDWLLFGLNGLWYSLHNILWLWLLGVSVYILLRSCGAGVMGATLAGALVISAPITLSVSAWYGTRHYLAGLCWSLLSLSAILEWNRRKRRWLYAAAIACYVLALWCKEVYFPLVLLAPLTVSGNKRRRRDILIGYGITAIVYLSLRQIVFNNVIAGYDGGRYNPLMMLQSLIESWPRLTETIVWGGGQPATFWPAVVFVNLLILACLIAAYKRAHWKGALLYLAALGSSLFAVSFVLGNPHIRFAERLDLCMNDRLNLAFSAAVMICLSYLLFVPGREVPDARRQHPGRRRHILALLAGLALLPLLWSGGSRSVDTWSTMKYHAWQWRFIEENLGSDMILTGANSRSLQTFIDLAARYHQRSNHISARGYFETEADWRDLDYKKVYLMVPGKIPLRASTRTEMMAWLLRYNTQPPFGSYVKIRRR